MKIQITDLPTADEFATGDLVWLKKSGYPYDYKITYRNFLKSIGNTGVKGFVAISQQQNKVTLSPSTGVEIDRYYDGMVVDFVSPITSNGIVQIKIGNLAYVDLQKLKGDQTAFLTQHEYYSAVFDANTNKFYQTNIIEPTVWSNEYEATAEIDPEEQATLLTLTSAIGASKTEYYKNMSLLFTSPIATKGVLFVNVDDLGTKKLKDPDGDLLSDDLDAGEAILAIYNGTDFIKHMFSTVEPPAPPLPADPDIPIPDANKRSVIVGPNRIFTSVENAVSQFIREFGENGGNHICTIRLAADCVWIPLKFNGSLKLNWITITSASLIPVDPLGFLFAFPNETGRAPTISGQFVVNAINDQTKPRINVDGSNVKLLNSIFNCSEGLITTIGFAVIRVGFFIISNSSISNYYLIKVTKESFFDSDNSTYKKTSIAIENSAMNLRSCTFDTSVAAEFVRAIDSNLKIEECSFSSVGTAKGLIFEGAECSVILKNVRVVTASGSIGVLAKNGAHVIIDGGDYRGAGGEETVSSIVASGMGTVIRLKNSVKGSYTAINDGQIIVES